LGRVLRKLKYKWRRLVRGPLPPVIAAVREARLSSLSKGALEDLYTRVRQIEKNRVPGVIIEAGCALGGSAIVMAATKSKDRRLLVYDVFGLIPAPSEKDGDDVHDRYTEIVKGSATGINGDTYYGYEDNLYQKVTDSFAALGYPVADNAVSLIKGLFEDTIHIDQPVALAHIDGDWYESVMTCLQRIEPHLAEGGVMVIDDYDAWSGCRTAVDEYFADKMDRYRFKHQARLHIVRK